LKRITADLKDYAKTGLRTLLLAQREVSEIELKKWETAYLEAQMSQSKDKDEILDKLIEDMENGLLLVGATAIEDKL
jgi:phospholipid-translocating ATPase